MLIRVHRALHCQFCSQEYPEGATECPPCSAKVKTIPEGMLRLRAKDYPKAHIFDPTKLDWEADCKHAGVEY